MCGVLAMLVSGAGGYHFQTVALCLVTNGLPTACLVVCAHALGTHCQGQRS